MAKNIDVKEIIEEIKNEIVQCGHSNSKYTNYLENEIYKEDCGIPTMEEVLASLSAQREEQSFAYLNEHYFVNFYRPIEKGNFVVMNIKKIIRRLIRFCVCPIVAEQSDVNFQLLELLRVQHSKVLGLEMEIRQLKEVILKGEKTT